jgi:hypothetical protein
LHDVRHSHEKDERNEAEEREGKVEVRGAIRAGGRRRGEGERRARKRERRRRRRRMRECLCWHGVRKVIVRGFHEDRRRERGGEREEQSGVEEEVGWCVAMLDNTNQS